MSKTYTKLFTSLLDSTIWQEDLATKVVWITLMAMADRDGVVSASVPGLMKRAGVTLDETQAALLKFLKPDPYSRTTDYEGRRIEAVDGGWRLLNHAKYRAMMNADDRREYQRLKQAQYRARKAARLGAPLAGEVAAVKAMERGEEEVAQRIAEERASEDPEVRESSGNVESNLGASSGIRDLVTQKSEVKEWGNVSPVSISSASNEEAKMDMAEERVALEPTQAQMMQAERGPQTRGAESGQWVDGEWVPD